MKNCENYEALASDCMFCDESKTCKYQKNSQANAAAFCTLTMLAVIIGGVVGCLLSKLIF